MVATKPASKVQLIVFTDLDGTLLDHDTYSYSEALPALDRLKALSVPIIPTTSKTFAELEDFVSEFGFKTPVIVENGGLIAVPREYSLDESEKFHQHENFYLIPLSVDYSSIISILENIKRAQEFNFQGFNDMAVEDVMRLTGLSEEKSAKAMQRLCSEPLIWQDTDSQLKIFEQKIALHGLRMVKGGRFWHVMGETDKSIAMKRVIQILGFDNESVKIIALGDNPNDINMLQAADIGVVIRRKDSSFLQFKSSNEIYTTELPGPAGWNEFFSQYLDKYQSKAM